MATGNWVRGRQGVSQSLDRLNPIATIAHLRRVTSQLASERENFDARDLHPTQFGKFCPIDSPEGPNIGLRKQLSLLARVTLRLRSESDKQDISVLKSLGLEVSNGTK
jgi:DNA-directed RNA polymerase beta subunit